VRAELLEGNARHSLLALSSARSRHDQTVLEDQITIAPANTSLRNYRRARRYAVEQVAIGAQRLGRQTQSKTHPCGRELAKLPASPALRR
jgi:hypothetical protein